MGPALYGNAMYKEHQTYTASSSVSSRPRRKNCRHRLLASTANVGVTHAAQDAAGGAVRAPASAGAPSHQRGAPPRRAGSPTAQPQPPPEGGAGASIAPSGMQTGGPGGAGTAPPSRSAPVQTSFVQIPCAPTCTQAV